MMVTLKYVFDDLRQAETVADMLRPQKTNTVQVLSLADETGGTEGNFLLEYKDEFEHNADRISSGAPFDPNINKGLGKQKMVHNDKVLLIVEVNDCDHARIHALMIDAKGRQID